MQARESTSYLVGCALEYAQTCKSYLRCGCQEDEGSLFLLLSALLTPLGWVGTWLNESLCINVTQYPAKATEGKGISFGSWFQSLVARTLCLAVGAYGS